MSDYAIEFEIPGLPKTPNARDHYMAKAKHVKLWRERVFLAAWPMRPPEPLRHARITFTRVSSVRPDFDNLVSSFKACMDGLRQAGVITDDKYANVGAPTYNWEKAKPNKGRVRIRVEEICKASELDNAI